MDPINSYYSFVPQEFPNSMDYSSSSLSSTGNFSGVNQEDILLIPSNHHSVQELFNTAFNPEEPAKHVMLQDLKKRVLSRFSPELSKKKVTTEEEALSSEKMDLVFLSSSFIFQVSDHIWSKEQVVNFVIAILITGEYLIFPFVESGKPLPADFWDRVLKNFGVNPDMTKENIVDLWTFIREEGVIDFSTMKMLAALYYEKNEKKFSSMIENRFQQYFDRIKLKSKSRQPRALAEHWSLEANILLIKETLKMGNFQTIPFAKKKNRIAAGFWGHVLKNLQAAESTSLPSRLNHTSINTHWHNVVVKRFKDEQSLLKLGQLLQEGKENEFNEKIIKIFKQQPSEAINTVSYTPSS